MEGSLDRNIDFGNFLVTEMSTPISSSRDLESAVFDDPHVFDHMSHNEGLFALDLNTKNVDHASRRNGPPGPHALSEQTADSSKTSTDRCGDSVGDLGSDLDVVLNWYNTLDKSVSSPAEEAWDLGGTCKPRCWDHGCNGREFSSKSNLVRHQKERAGQTAKVACPLCGGVFTRNSARDTHLAKQSCNRIRRYSNGRQRPSKIALFGNPNLSATVGVGAHY